MRWPNERPSGPNVEFSLASDLLDSLLLPVRKRVARQQLGQAESRVAHAVLSLAAQVKASAYTVQAGEQFHARLAAIADVNEASADLAQRQYDAGNINRLELANQQLAAQQAHLELIRTDAQLRRDREKFNRLLGLSSAQTNWKIAAELPALPETDTLPENLEDLAVNQRLDLAALGLDKAAAADVDALAGQDALALQLVQHAVALEDIAQAPQRLFVAKVGAGGKVLQLGAAHDKCIIVPFDRPGVSRLGQAMHRHRLAWKSFCRHGLARLGNRLPYGEQQFTQARAGLRRNGIERRAARHGLVQPGKQIIDDFFIQPLSFVQRNDDRTLC